MINAARAICASILGAILLPACLLAQDATGKITGVVTDPSGAVVTSANVTVTNLETNFSKAATTDSSGVYQALLLPIGKYKITASAAGFEKVTMVPQNALEINQTMRVDIQLPVGKLTDTVVVESTAKAIIGHFGGESGEGGDEGLGAVLNLNGDGAALGAVEGVIIGVVAIHDIGFDDLIEANFGGVEDVVVGLESVKGFHGGDGERVGTGGLNEAFDAEKEGGIGKRRDDFAERSSGFLGFLGPVQRTVVGIVEAEGRSEGLRAVGQYDQEKTAGRGRRSDAEAIDIVDVGRDLGIDGSAERDDVGDAVGAVRFDLAGDGVGEVAEFEARQILAGGGILEVAGENLTEGADGLGAIVELDVEDAEVVIDDGKRGGSGDGFEEHGGGGILALVHEVGSAVETLFDGRIAEGLALKAPKFLAERIGVGDVAGERQMAGRRPAGPPGGNPLSGECHGDQREQPPDAENPRRLFPAVPAADSFALG